MNPKTTFFQVFSVVLVLLVATTAFSEDWPKWLGAKGDSVWNEAETIDKFPESEDLVKWRVPVNVGYTGPAVADGRVFVMDRKVRESTEEEKASWEKEKEEAKKAAEAKGERPKPMFKPLHGNERVLCLDEKTGKEIWSHTYERPYQISYPEGPRTTPLIEDNRVYTLGAMGDLICFDTADGAILWQKDLAKEYKTSPPVWGFSAHLDIDGDKLICLVGGKGTGCVALNKNDGKEIWRAIDAQEICYAPPIFHEKDMVRQLLVWHDVAIVSLNPENGKQNWSCEFPKKPPQRPAVSIITPRIQDDILFVSDFYNGSLALKLKNNAAGYEELWQTDVKDMSQRKFLNTLMTTPFVKDGNIYGINGKGEMRCLDLETGDTRWETRQPSVGDLEKAKLERPILFATSFIVSNNDKFFIFNDQGFLIIAEMNAEGYKELDRKQFLEATGFARGRKIVWSHPAFANGCMIARNDKEIICVKLTK